MQKFAKINKTYRSNTINSTHRVTKPTGRTGFQQLTELIGPLVLKEHIYVLGLTAGKGLQILTGHTG